MSRSDQPTYRKISPKIWEDMEGMGSEEMVVALYALTSLQTNRCGIFRLSPGAASEYLGMSPQSFEKRLKAVCKAFRWQWDEKRKVLYIPTWWKYNQPANPKHLTGNLKDLDTLPSTCLIPLFSENLAYLSETLFDTFILAMEKRYGEGYAERYVIPSPIGYVKPEAEAEAEAEAEEPRFSPEVEKLSALAFKNFAEAGHKKPTTPGQIEKAKDTIRLMVERDGDLPEEIEAGLHFIHQDTGNDNWPGWRATVQSVNGFRKKWPKIKPQMLHHRTKGAPTPQPIGANKKFSWTLPKGETA